jgi:hypothetical protein
MAEYEPKEVDISFSLLLELMDALKGYGSDVVVIGGWAPYFLLKSFSHATEEHVGSLDADLALNFQWGQIWRTATQNNLSRKVSRVLGCRRLRLRVVVAGRDFLVGGCDERKTDGQWCPDRAA